MGSKPTEKFVFMIDNFDVLAEIKEQLAIKACEGKRFYSVNWESFANTHVY